MTLGRLGMLSYVLIFIIFEMTCSHPDSLRLCHGQRGVEAQVRLWMKYRTKQLQPALNNWELLTISSRHEVQFLFDGLYSTICFFATQASSYEGKNSRCKKG
jgi:hypothetical protein